MKTMEKISLYLAREQGKVTLLDWLGQECFIKMLQFEMPDDVSVYYDDPVVLEIEASLRSLELRTGFINGRCYTAADSDYQVSINSYANLVGFRSLIMMLKTVVDEYNAGVEYGSNRHSYFKGASKHYAAAEDRECSSMINAVFLQHNVSSDNHIIMNVESGEIVVTNFFNRSPILINEITKDRKREYKSLGFFTFGIKLQMTALLEDDMTDEMLALYESLPAFNNILNEYVRRDGLDMIIDINTLSDINKSILRLVNGFSTVDKMVEMLS